jgi:hypothetical protein
MDGAATASTAGVLVTVLLQRTGLVEPILLQLGGIVLKMTVVCPGSR